MVCEVIYNIEGVVACLGDALRESDKVCKCVWSCSLVHMHTHIHTCEHACVRYLQTGSGM